MLKINDIIQIEIPERHHSTNYYKEPINIIGIVVDTIEEEEEHFNYKYITIKIISSTYNGNFKHPFGGKILDNEFVFSDNWESAGYIPEENIKKLE